MYDDTFGYSFIFNSTLHLSNNFYTGFKIDENNFLEIELDKKSQDTDIKIYGNKIIILDYIQ